RHLVERCARRYRKRIEAIPAAVLEAFARYDWPGNVRELENVIERSVILTEGPVLEVALSELRATPREIDPGRGRAAAEPPRTLGEKEREWILGALEESRWVVGGRNGAAARLGLSRTTLQARMRKHGLARPK